jgi:hypothetical protein
VHTLWDDIRFPALLVASWCITTLVALILLRAAIVCIDLAAGSSPAWLCVALAESTIVIGLVVFAGDFIRRL